MSAHRTAHDMAKADKVIADPGNAGSIYVDRNNAVVQLTSAGAETRTLARPTQIGNRLSLHFKSDGGNITLTVTGGFNEDGDTTFTFSDPGQFVCFESFYDGTDYYWRKTSDYGLGNIAPGDSSVLDEFSAVTATAEEINAAADVSERVVNVTNAATYTVLAANSGKPHIMPDFSASCTLTLPTAAAGLEFEFISKAVAADAQNWVFDTGSAAAFYLGGLAFADTDAGAGADEIHAGVFPNGSSNDIMTIVTPGAGTRIKLVCDGTNWIVCGQVFSATVPTFSDT